MISVILAFITAIPSLVNGFTAFTNKYYDTKAKITIARINGDVSVVQTVGGLAAVEQHSRIEALKVVASNKVLLYVFALYLVPPGLYRAKIYVVDKLIGPGCVWWTNLCWMADTDPLGSGDVGASDHLIITFMFGSATALALGQRWFTRPGASDK